MNEDSVYDILINDAIDNQDFESALHWVNLKYSQLDGALVKEDLTTAYGILEENKYIRKIKDVTEKEFFDNVVVAMNKTGARRGEVIPYTVLNTYERWFLFGYYKGISKNGYGAYYF